MTPLWRWTDIILGYAPQKPQACRNIPYNDDLESNLHDELKSFVLKCILKIPR